MSIHWPLHIYPDTESEDSSERIETEIVFDDVIWRIGANMKAS